ncbi:MAG TPA: YcxB family protein, partial [Tepidisphaeraceae bacterium]|nr:YcxB family protein [Tepidisphaeraceae bacterium]
MNWIVPAFIYIATALVMAVRIRAIAVQYQLMAAIGGQADASSIAELVVGTVPILIIFGGIIFFQKPLMRIVRRANWRAQTNLHRPTTFEFSPDGMIETHELARCEYRWEFFPGFRESRETFLVYPSAMMFHIFPKRAFANPAEVDEFRAMLDEKIRKVTY